MSIAIAGSVVVAIAPEQIVLRRVMVSAALLLMAAGYLRVANRVSAWRRAIIKVVALLHLAWLAWVIARPFVELEDWEYRVLAATLWWSGIVLVTIAARAWWTPATWWVVVAGVLAVVLEALSWAPYLAPAFDSLVEKAPTFEPWIRPLRELLTSAAIVVLVRAIP